MEAVAVGSSITSLLGFAGQAIDGALKLRSFFAECSKASKSVSRFLDELKALIDTLEDVKDIIKKLNYIDSGSVPDGILASLQIQLDDCSKEVHEWVRTAGELHPGFSTGTKQVFKKFLVAVKKSDREDIYSDVGRHRANITTKLSVIGRSLDIEHSAKLRELTAKIEVVQECQVTTEALANLQTNLQGQSSGFSMSGSSPASLCSIASQLSRIESALSDRRPSGAWPILETLTGPDNGSVVMPSPRSASQSPFARSSYSATGPSPSIVQGQEQSQGGTYFPGSSFVSIFQPKTMPVDFSAASKLADEKRARNAGASARFRARRKEKEAGDIEHMRKELKKKEDKLKEIEYLRDAEKAMYRSESTRLLERLSQSKKQAMNLGNLSHEYSYIFLRTLPAANNKRRYESTDFQQNDQGSLKPMTDQPATKKRRYNHEVEDHDESEASHDVFVLSHPSQENELARSLHSMMPEHNCVEYRVPNTVLVTGLRRAEDTETFVKHIESIPHTITPHLEFVALFLHFYTREDALEAVKAMEQDSKWRHIRASMRDSNGYGPNSPDSPPYFNRHDKEVPALANRGNLKQWIRDVLPTPPFISPCCIFPSCQYSFSSVKEDLVSHIEFEHLHHPYTCPHCKVPQPGALTWGSLRFETEESLYRHVRENHLRSARLEHTFALRAMDDPYLPTSSINTYIKQARLAMALKAHYSMFDTMPLPFGDGEGLALADCRFQAQRIIDLGRIEEMLRESRQICWKEGHNLDNIDNFLLTFNNSIPGTDAISGTNSQLLQLHAKNGLEEHKSPEVEMNTLFPLTTSSHPQTQTVTKTWATKQDRINFWLLNNLQESESEAVLHRSYLKDCSEALDLSDEQWAREVLKYWPLDGAAVGPTDKVVSTNGAVDSKGFVHSIQAGLGLNMMTDRAGGEEMEVDIDDKDPEALPLHSRTAGE